MKATELRIGNWYDNGEGSHYIIDVPTMHDILTEHVLYDGKITIKPIPLTEEWLERFKFELDYEGDYILAWRGVVFYFRLSDMSLRRDYKQKNKLSIIPIDYVHQLQNLYFALTGEELTLIK